MSLSPNTGAGSGLDYDDFSSASLSKMASPRKKSEIAEVLTGQMWAKNDDMYFACDTAVDKLGAGFYVIGVTQDGSIFFKHDNPVTDELFDIPKSPADTIIKHVEEFWKSEDLYKQYNLIWKRGVLLFGDPGSGKSSIVHLVSRRIIANDGVVFYGDHPGIIIKGLKQFRKIEPKRPILLILEDIDAMCQHYEQQLLSLLDGEVQVDNIVILCTTNYPEKLDRRITNRPRRIDIIQKIDVPDEPARRYYLTKKCPELVHQMMPQENNPVRQSFETDEKELVTSIARLEAELEELRVASAGDKLLEYKNKDRIEKIAANITVNRTKLSTLQQEFSSVDKQQTVLDYIVENTHGLSLSHLVEIVVYHKVFKSSVEESVKRMVRMTQTRVNAKTGANLTNIS